MRSLLVPSLCALALSAACSPATPQPQAHSKPALLLDQTTAQPGTQIRIGIQFQMDKDWHIYWMNPGDSGEPPRVLWQLPEGVTAGALLWPTPARMPTSAGTDYGYQGDAVLLATLGIPASVQPGTNLPIAADLRWLVCHDICMPQHAQLKASLPIANSASLDSSAHQLLAAAAERIPGPLPASFHLAVASSRDHLRLRFSPGTKVTSAIFFPAEPEQIDNAAPQEFDTIGNISRLELKKSDNLQRDPQRLQGLLVLNGQRAYQVSIALQPNALRRNSSAHKENKL